MGEAFVIIPRSEWGALAPKQVEPITRPPIKVVLTYDLKINICKTREDCIAALQELQRRHVDKENSDDIKFNFLIGGNGDVFEGRGWHARSCKSLKFPAYHHKRLDIGFIGDYVSNEFVPFLLHTRALHLVNRGKPIGLVDENCKVYESIGPPDYGNPVQRMYDSFEDLAEMSEE